MIEHDFYAKILSIPGVASAVGNRVYYGIADQDEILPLIVIAMEGLEREYAADRVCKEETNVTVTIIGGDYFQTRGLQKAITEGIENDDFGADTHRPLLTSASMIAEKKDDAADANLFAIEMVFNVIGRG